MNDIFKHILRVLAILIVQIALFKQVDLSYQNFNYIHIFIYPIFILLLPFSFSNIINLLIAFALGISVDLFYNSLGVHAFALVFMTFLRPIVLGFLEPREGYNKEASPTIFRMGIPWVFIYTSVLLFFHHFIYFSMEVFSPVYPSEIILRTIFSFIVSLILIMLGHFIFRFKN